VGRGVGRGVGGGVGRAVGAGVGFAVGAGVAGGVPVGRAVDVGPGVESDGVAVAGGGEGCPAAGDDGVGVGPTATRIGVDDGVAEAGTVTDGSAETAGVG
jgi:hypothetical protein